MAGVGVYPGSFNPPTIAHLAIAEAARRQVGLSRIDLAVSRVALGKQETDHPTFEDRLMVLEAVAASRPWLGVVVSDAQLIADIARGYDAVILGADKWAQVIDPSWYHHSETARDAALAGLPRVLVAPRPPFSPSPGPHVELLSVVADHAAISSTAVRSGHREWMAPEAAAFDAETGAWSDPERYARWLATPGARADRRRRGQRATLEGVLDDRGDG
jgi:nicotinic acid mononucleotide adenylyltransferase